MKKIIVLLTTLFFIGCVTENEEMMKTTLSYCVPQDAIVIETYIKKPIMGVTGQIIKWRGHYYYIGYSHSVFMIEITEKQAYNK
jgi:hypothetical protein